MPPLRAYSWALLSDRALDGTATSKPPRQKNVGVTTTRPHRRKRRDRQRNVTTGEGSLWKRAGRAASFFLPRRDRPALLPGRFRRAQPKEASLKVHVGVTSLLRHRYADDVASERAREKGGERARSLKRQPPLFSPLSFVPVVRACRRWTRSGARTWRN